jgi:Family of unknown function (DUF5681)
MSDSDSAMEETPRRYRNPPIEHRFRKGVSGNPRGRPRKERAPVSTTIGGQPRVGFEERVKSVAAANGNTRAQLSYLNLLTGAEADRRMATEELLKNAIECKEHWGRVLAERARSGATGPEPVPHPDDVISSRQEKSDSMVRLMRNRRRRRNGCVPTRRSWYDG